MGAMSFVNVIVVFVSANVIGSAARTKSTHTLRDIGFAIGWLLRLSSDLIVWFLILFAATRVKQEMPVATMSYISKITSSELDWCNPPAGPGPDQDARSGSPRDLRCRSIHAERSPE